MRYSSGSAFRRALEDRILKEFKATGMPISRLRKLISFDRFLARLVIVAPEQWVLKGGYFMELCFHLRSRTTKDIDLLFLENKRSIHKQLTEAAKNDLHDWFTFQVSQPSISSQGLEATQRYQVTAYVDSRTFEEFHIDINANDALIENPQLVSSTKFYGFSEITPFQIPCYSLVQQLAEKFHALTRTYKAGDSSRVKDLVDILLIAGNTKIKYGECKNALTKTFHHRHTHELPSTAPELSSNYSREFTKLSKEVNLSQLTILEGNNALQLFINPILEGIQKRIWDPRDWNWK